MRHIKNIIIFIVSALFSGGMISCDSSEADASADMKDSVRVADTLGGMKVFLLPSPLQVASVIKLSNLKYSQKIFDKTEKASADYQVSYLKALNLGIYSIDMGYATVYNDYSTSAKYAAKIQTTIDDLGIKSGMKKNTKERVQQNRNNNDSLYKIILESHRDAHEYFKSNQREDVGLMVLTGAFIEGLYVSSSLAKESHDQKLMELVGQQKIFLQNISELLKKYADQKDIKTIITKMDALGATYAAIDVHYDSAKDKLSNTSISEEQLSAICRDAGEIRNEIVN